MIIEFARTSGRKAKEPSNGEKPEQRPEQHPVQHVDLHRTQEEWQAQVLEARKNRWFSPYLVDTVKNRALY